MENACVRASWVTLTLTARPGRREKNSRGDQGGISREAGKKPGEHNSWGVGEGCPTVQCCGEGQCGHTQLAAGFSHTEAIGQEHFLCSDGWGGQAGVILREAGETWVTMDTINSEQFPWRGAQGNGGSGVGWGGGGGRGSRIRMAGKQFVHRWLERI